MLCFVWQRQGKVTKILRQLCVYQQDNCQLAGGDNFAKKQNMVDGVVCREELRGYKQSGKED